MDFIYSLIGYTFVIGCCIAMISIIWDGIRIALDKD